MTATAAALLAPKPVIPTAQNAAASSAAADRVTEKNAAAKAASERQARASADKDAAKEAARASHHADRAAENAASEQVQADATAIDEQFAAMLSGMMFINPPAASTAPSMLANTAVDTESAMPPRAFNWDPAMLVINTANTDTTPATAGAAFDDALVKALTPGLPDATGTQSLPQLPLTGTATSAVLPSTMANTAANTALPPTVVTTPADTADANPAMVACGLTIPVLGEASGLGLGKSSANAKATVVTLSQPETLSGTNPNVTTTAPVAASAAAPAATAETGTQWFKRDTAANTAFSNGEATVTANSAADGGYVPSHVGNGANAGKLSGSTLLAAQGDPAAAAASTAASGGLDDIGAQSLLGDVALDGTTLLTATAGGATSPSTGVQSSTLAYTPAAGASHPASQVIAATLQTVAADKPKSFTLALTPAELGRVVVDMKLDADKKMKIVMTVENDSTFHLLQRDQTALQGFLDKAGLARDTEVTFQLASDQQNFDQAAGDRQAFSQDNTPSWRVGAASGHDADALQAGLTSDLADAKGNGRWQINRLV